MIWLGVGLMAAALPVCLAGLVQAIRRRAAGKLLLTAAGLLLCGAVVVLFSAAPDAAERLTLLALLAGTAGIVLLLAALVQKLRRRPAALLGRSGAGALAAGLVVLLAGIGTETSAYLLLGGLLCILIALLAALWLLVRWLRKKPLGKSRFTAPGALLLAVVLLVSYGTVSQREQECAAAESEIRRLENLQTELDFEVADGTEPLEPVEYYTWQSGDETRVQVYGSEYLELLLDEGEATAEDCRQAIRENDQLPERFQDYFLDFVDRIEDIYPEADLRILCHNLKTLTVTELSEQDYYWKTLSYDSQGCYFANENAIYIPEGTEYVEGEWGFQVLLHEFCHAARTCWRDGNSYNKADFRMELEDDLLNECMNSAFSCSLLSYYEWDIAYQTPSNYLRVMLECMDNYSLTDYMNHGSAYFYSKLDEAEGYTNYAQTIWKLISLQRSDWGNDSIEIPAEDYDPIYDFLCEMYFARYLTEDMTDEEAKAVADELVYKLFYDTPEDYPIDTQRIYDNLETWQTGGVEALRNAA